MKLLLSRKIVFLLGILNVVTKIFMTDYHVEFAIHFDGSDNRNIAHEVSAASRNINWLNAYNPLL